MTPVYANCRWCNTPFPPMPEEIHIGDPPVNRSRCSQCHAFQGSILHLGLINGGLNIDTYFNPDHSLYIEFVGNGTNARYVLSPDRLRDLGLLVEFDHDPHGVRAVEVQPNTKGLDQ